jgi:hypothetical protein
MTSVKIQEAKYEFTDVDIVAEQQRHLNPHQRDQLKHLLQKYTKLYSKKIGSYPHRKPNLYVDPQNKHRLCYQRPYLVPRLNLETFKQKLD